MNQYNWTNCPDPVRTQIKALLNAFRQVLGTDLVGVYLHGSLAIGCFNPERSDIDLLVVTTHRMIVETKRRIAELLLQYSAAPSPIEISFLTEPELSSFQHPMPFDFGYGEDWRKKCQEELLNGQWMKWNETTRKDPDLAAHFTMVLNRGICLFGKPIKEVFPSVPAEDYTASIVSDFAWGRERMTENPVYFILNACRIYAYLREGQILSKDEAGAWALSTLPEEFHAMIAQALDAYRGERKDVIIDQAELERFAAYFFRS